MINDVIKAISIALNAEFGPDYEIYGEEIRQGLEEPCFFISTLNLTNEKFLGRRYFRKNPFVIQFFPEEGKEREQCNNVAERLMSCLEYITVPGDDKPIQGTDQHCEMQDDVLHFFINYDLFMIKDEKDDPMEEMKLYNEVR